MSSEHGERVNLHKLHGVIALARCSIMLALASRDMLGLTVAAAVQLLKSNTRRQTFEAPVSADFCCCCCFYSCAVLVSAHHHGPTCYVARASLDPAPPGPALRVQDIQPEQAPKPAGQQALCTQL